MKSVNAALIQADLAWEDKKTNLNRLEKMIKSQEKAEIILLPELFNTAFSLKNAALYEDMNGPAVEWLCNQSIKQGADIAGSVLIKEDNKVYNRLIWVSAGEISGYYDKRHLFRMGNEHQWISSGQKNRVIQSHGLLFMPQICYDLRFPVWHRNQVENGRFKYDVLTFHANWPEVRIQAWRMLLIARAIENQAYVVGINRCGVDGNGIFHSGESMVVGPQGNILAEASRGKESILHFTMYHDDLISWRNNFQVSNDWDDFKITD